ncbi:helix-turn-helix domain-containing protein [Enterococcus faecalis]|uniref:helix-turn-helix transcriptional regulator n=1 Tax=Enterococcus faecalis TaxID=1351 RepID=UPI002DBE5F84|nr:helix-turn-helix transcriptional regulator [Enterococcus faecalis]MEB7428337.1 helix-turn-helix domain-containing protein [Enterococcus faecalis]
MNLAMYAGNKIKELRKRDKITQGELAKKIGIGKSAISNYESGYRMPKQDLLFKLANVFNESVDIFFPNFINEPISELLSLDKKIATNIKEIRTQKQLSKESVADKLGISIKELTLYEEQQKPFTIDVVFNFAKALGVTFDDLFPAEGKFDEIPAILKIYEEENKVETASGEFHYLTDEEMIFLKNFLIFTNRK